MKPLCSVIGTLLLSALLPWPSTGQFHVIGPSAPVVAVVGKEAVLSCHLNPVKDAQNMVVMWHRNHPSGLVHRYGASQDHMEQQISWYHGRTEFLKENITKGQAALRIHSIRPSDAGEYSCSFESSTYNSGAQFKVLVTGTGMIPHIRIEPGNTRKIKLTCTSTGWYPEPEVQWRDLQGQHLTPDSETKTAEENQLFRVKTSVTVDKNSRGAVSCLIWNPVLSEVKEVHISVADALFPRSNPWKVAFFMLLFLLIVAVTIDALYVVRARKAKGLLEWKRSFYREGYALYERSTEITEWESSRFRNKSILLVRRMESEMKEKDEIISFLDPTIAQRIQDLNKARRFSEIRGKEQYPLDLTSPEDIKLDKTTAHPNLQVSENGKYVTSPLQRHNLPDTSERLDTPVAVLGQNSFSDGDHYWEVRISARSTWALGLCVNSISRKRKGVSVSPGNNFWTLSQTNGTCKALSSSCSLLNIPKPPRILGIFLQYEKGLISFYNVTDYTILYTFKSNFTQPLKPYFSLSEGSSDGFTILKVLTDESIVRIYTAAEES